MYMEEYLKYLYLIIGILCIYLYRVLKKKFYNK